MTIGPGLGIFLLADPAIAALVGAGNSARIYPVQLPQQHLGDSIRFTTISGSRVVSSRFDLGLSSPRIQIDAWSTTYKGAAVLADLILKRLSAYRGYFVAPATTFVQGAFFDNERDGYEPESKLYFFSRDYFIHFEDPLS